MVNKKHQDKRSSSWSLTALRMAVVMGLLSCGMIAAMITLYYWKGRGKEIHELTTLTALQVRLERDPGNEVIKEEIRAQDLKLRKDFFKRQLMIDKGRYILLVFLAGLLVSVKWRLSFDPKLPEVKRKTEGYTEKRNVTSRSCNLISVSVVIIALGFFMIAMTLLPRKPLPSIEVWEKGPGEEDIKEVGAEEFSQNWHQLRGPTGMGIVKEGEFPLKWNGGTSENILWKSKVPSEGHSSPVIWNDRIFLTGSDGKRLQVFCFERSTGQLLWDSRVITPRPIREGEDEVSDMGAGMAAPTPVTDGRFIYVTFDTADIACFDLLGRQVWVRNLGEPQNTYGLASSLIVWKDLLILQLDQGSVPEDKRSAILALDKKDGDIVWRTERPVSSSWSTPVIIEIDGSPEMITCGNPWVIAYHPDDGRELWRAEGLAGDVVAMPVYAEGLVFAVHSEGQLMAIRPGGQGNVTETHVVWTADEGLPSICSPVTDGSRLLLSEYGDLTCYQVKTGKLLWQGSTDGDFWASPSLVGKLVYLPDKEGKMFIVELGDQYKLLSQADVGEPVTASPAFVNGHIYIRGKEHLFCIGKEE